LLAGLDRAARIDAMRHEMIHGPLPLLGIAELTDLSSRIGLRGRGGAGFPFARKLSAVHKSAQRRGLGAAVVVNATEGEPASVKDKLLINAVPHLVLDGALIAALALDARDVVIGIAAGSAGEKSMLSAIAEQRVSDFVHVMGLPEKFVTGEGGALVRGIDGQKPIPPGRKVRSSDSGIGGIPTLLSNAETFAQLALAARLGAAGYSAVGTATEPGTMLFTIWGPNGRPTVLEAPVGTPLPQLLGSCDAAGAVAAQGVLVGGYHGMWLRPEVAASALASRDGLAAAGGALGAGVIVPLPPDICALSEVGRVATYLAAQSSGQCGPCRMGLPNAARALLALTNGHGNHDTLELLQRTASFVRGRGACGHPDGTSRFILSALTTFADEIAAHIATGSCGRPIRRVLPLPAEGNEKRLTVDWSRCSGHGICAHAAPNLVNMDGNGFPVISDAPVADWFHSEARRAVRACPALALRVTRQ